MKRSWIGMFLVAVATGASSSCESKLHPGHVTFTIEGGKVDTVDVTMPSYGGTMTLQLTSKDEVEELIQNLESMVVDLKEVQGRMPTIEPPLLDLEN